MKISEKTKKKFQLEDRVVKTAKILHQNHSLFHIVVVAVVDVDVVVVAAAVVVDVVALVPLTIFLLLKVNVVKTYQI